MQTLTNQTTLVRTGAICAILGAVLQVGAGIAGTIALGTIPTGNGAEELLPALASQSVWAWTTIQMGFVLGPVMWVMAFVALMPTITQGWASTLAKLATATILAGSAIHIVSSSVNGFAVAELARQWQTAAASEQANLVVMGNLLLAIIDGTWASAITLFHGLPFVLSGLAVIASGRYPAYLGWVGVLGGLGSVVAGPLLFFGAEGLATGLSIISAVVISIYTLIVGLLMWNASPNE